MRFAASLCFLILAACTGKPEGVTPITGFEVNRYLGTWYEIRRLDHSFERGLDNVTATYSLREDGKISVLNKGLNRETCEWDEADGVARFLGEETVGSLGVTFQWPFEGGYHIIDLADDYSHAMISGPDRGYLWILSRSPEMEKETLTRLIDKAGRLDFPVQDLITVRQDDPPCP